MQRNISGQYPFHIKRGKKLVGSAGVASYLQHSDKIAPLLPTIKRNALLQKECQQFLPTMFQRCEVLQLAEDCLTLATPNAAIASKLKQNLPKLQLHLQQQGWQVSAIRVKVQVRPQNPYVPEKKQLFLSQNAILAFSRLEDSLEKTGQNQELLAALERLIQRHRNKET